MSVVINELEMLALPAERSAPPAPPSAAPIKPELDATEVVRAVRQQAERMARVRAD